MTVKRENLTLDMYYASETENGDKVAKITIVLRDNTSGEEVHTSTLTRTGEATKGKYSVRYQSISNASDPLLIKLETHFRGADQTLFENLMKKVDAVYTSSLNTNSTWMGQLGLRIISGEKIDTIVPESVFA
ncbi:hypothetical protein ABSL22_002793 [Escherichia coli]|uniref:hypothetical protein n=2 Tax=Escherichia coli TaxID=562 RepID=UPI0007A57050|nr:hypothetical protein [Escherichia coli]EFO4453548.1 hypothetical protein [Escherichia coli]EHU9125395.1 hypothetical protein [Escherichia coli]EJZ1813865.1 hypothetical protein [Escherichia coli]MBS8932923.1 hypothetical protein [Escherichia coli]